MSRSASVKRKTMGESHPPTASDWAQNSVSQAKGAATQAQRDIKVLNDNVAALAEHMAILVGYFEAKGLLKLDELDGFTRMVRKL